MGQTVFSMKDQGIKFTKFKEEARQERNYLNVMNGKGFPVDPFKPSYFDGKKEKQVFTKPKDIKLSLVRDLPFKLKDKTATLADNSYTVTMKAVPPGEGTLKNDITLKEIRDKLAEPEFYGGIVPGVDRFEFSVEGERKMKKAPATYSALRNLAMKLKADFGLNPNELNLEIKSEGKVIYPSVNE